MAVKRHHVPVFARPPISAAVTLVFDKLLPAAGVVTSSTQTPVKSLRAEVLSAETKVLVEAVRFLDLSGRV
jgi:hypothetical protein